MAVLIVAAGCGGGVDDATNRVPVNPTTPVPPPEPPGEPTGVEVAERGLNFLVWTWNPVEGATGYEAHAFLAGTPPSERTNPAVFTEEPTVRVDGLEPDTAMEIFVRAVRETTGGRAVSPWSDVGFGVTLLPPAGPVGVCEDEREQALAYGSLLAHEWNPDRPFGFDIDTEGIQEGGERIGRPDFLEEEVLQPLRDVARRIEERLGYPILTPTLGGDEIRIFLSGGVNAPEKPLSGCRSNIGSAMGAAVGNGSMAFHRYFFDPEITCVHYQRAREWETVVHELGHLLGMTHDPDTTGEDPQLPGIRMSVQLTFQWNKWRAAHPGDGVGHGDDYGESDVYLTVADIDALGCAFPHPDFPR